MEHAHFIDMESWERKETFRFFKAFDNPHLNMTVPIDAQAIYACAKEKGESFFLLCLYSILRAANEVPQVRQRIQNDRVIEFARVAAMTPIMTPSEIFCQIWCEYAPTFDQFAAEVKPLVAAGKQGISNVPENCGDNYVCASVVPWVHFTSISQADRAFEQDVPILAWGKMLDGRIPVAGKFHHGLMDGLHLGRFFSKVEYFFANPHTLWSAEK